MKTHKYFQEETLEKFQVFGADIICIDDVIITTRIYFLQKITKLEKLLQKIAEPFLKVK